MNVSYHAVLDMVGNEYKDIRDIYLWLGMFFFLLANAEKDMGLGFFPGQMKTCMFFLTSILPSLLHHCSQDRRNT
jgi:hypothetical protein